ncbi:hypothetical protein KGP17_22585 [Serratia sp. JSRIV001]|uniref:DUF6931 family protein n=1 Tax=unclassified Serratia (in: enterobacteria) TaxID=2647522 RepID=UPI001CBC82A5|nr:MULTISPECIES: hypothetical protein [unclassified Serratia (in: enterobacteria)]UAN45162.1 hypothetical protein KGP17_22585 [Serratia sp. JSRIV001]UAN50669.1 hypothetical protein KGP26_23625 [Serratia sp. JSRIV002]UAN56626.1 hypothetical protein KGP21_23800 [Serratia sp. JSRIV004]UAN62233.1 hypothetical protein KGP16_22120 [Serratia sp. JSRIV006]
MSEHLIYPSAWGSEALQLVNTGRWEQALQLWTEQVAPARLCVWLAEIVALEQASDGQLLDQIRRWPVQKSDALRWRIFHLAEAQGFDTPAGALGLSLFWSEGSMSPEGLEPIFPVPQLSRQMCHCMLLMWVIQSIDNPDEGARNLLTQWINQENK